MAVGQPPGQAITRRAVGGRRDQDETTGVEQLGAATIVTQTEAGHGRSEAGKTFSRQASAGAEGVDVDTGNAGLQLKAAEVKSAVVRIV